MENDINKSQFETSLTHIGDIEGISDIQTTYGAEYIHVDMMTPYYERTIHTVADVPWLGQPMEKTYMNVLKTMNEKVPDLDFNVTSIPTDKYEKIEGFSKKETKDLYFKIACICFLMILVYFLMTEIK